MKNQNQLIQNSLPLIAAGLGDKLGVRVTVSGDQAWTDGTTINIPDFNITSKEQKAAVLGFLSHEAAHLKFDSFAVRNRIHSTTMKNYWNIFEDMRIENAMIDCMVGTKTWINQIWINRQNDGSRPPITDQAEPYTAICELLLMTCRVKYRGQAHLQPYLDAAESAFCFHFGYKLYMQLASLLHAELPLVDSSNAAFDLAEKVDSLISNYEPEDDSEDEKEDESQSEQEAEDGEAESSPGSSSETSEEDGSQDESGSNETSEDGEQSGCSTDLDEDGESTDSNNSTTESNQGEQDGETSSKGSNFGQQVMNEPTSEQIVAAIQAAMNNSEEFDDMDGFADSLEVLAKASGDSSSVSLPDVINVDAQSGLHTTVETVVNATSSQITAKLQSIVEENMRVRCKTKISGLKLNSKTLHRYAVNDARLFKQKGTKRQIDTVVELCLDNSGSMTAQGLMRTAIEAQMALAKALSRINGVSITASAFPDRSCENVLNLLDEGENVKRLAMRYHQVQGNAGCTPTASAMWHCIRKVLNSKRSNKVIIVITDGHPDDDQRDPLIKLVRKATNSGITVIGVAIGSIAEEKHKFYQFFPNALFIQNIKELKSELFKVAKDILVAK
ncbi:hypothetical protein VA249_45240 (plasmid) [Vibrio alfacsensis]|uniref:VWA domain-containing protein n=1 Tax=Vibrio alfacsensis TaxID=1074311 RepID=UPI001BEFFB7D|nr:VWA domain-containing protein [Vibrio alfacsensis]BBM67878.1 hypothetical protein VA249_45240 [Vibrio alfacsensis]